MDIGKLLAVVFLVSAALCVSALAEPSNAPDVRGRFTLVVSERAIGTGNPHPSYEDAMLPLTVIPGFDSFYRCRAAGMELQARMRSDGYVLDFSCLLQGK